MKENYKYEQIKRYVDQGGNFRRLCLVLNVSHRTGRRLIAGYKKEGKAFFLHGNRGRKPASQINKDIKDKIKDLYLDPLYKGANFKHFYELLKRNHPELSSLSLTSLRNILKEANIISPMATRATKREYNKRMCEQEKGSDVENIPLEVPLPIDKDPHPRREKSKNAGELIFADASMHDWLETGQKIHLHAAIDDAEGRVVGAHFEVQETIIGYYHVLRQILTNYGIPFRMQTDGRSIFEYGAFSRPYRDKETFTQFAYACHTLGIELNTTPSAQAQGKIERLFGTLQSRLVIELRLRKIKTIKEANEFLQVYLPQYNAQFATSLPNNTLNVYEGKPSKETINLTLAIINHRTIDNGNCIRFENAYYRLIDKESKQVNLRPKTKVLVIKALDGSLYASCNEKVFALEKVNTHKESSSNFDVKEVSIKKKTVTIPDMTHPWKREYFEKQKKKIWEKIYDEDWNNEYSYEDILYTLAKVY